jgi:sec-independent protein translocase protein TatB
MFGIGMPELILILAIALIVIGPKKLPDLAKSLGKAMGEFKKATSDLKDSMQIDSEVNDLKTAFNDIHRDVKEEARMTATDDTEEAPAEAAEADIPAGEQTADAAAEPTDRPKTASVDRSTNASAVESGADAGIAAPATEADAAAEPMDTPETASVNRSTNTSAVDEHAGAGTGNTAPATEADQDAAGRGEQRQ